MKPMIVLVALLVGACGGGSVGVVDMSRVHSESQLVQTLNAAIDDDGLRVQRQVNEIDAEAEKLEKDSPELAKQKHQGATRLAKEGNDALAKRRAARDQKVLADVSRIAGGLAENRGMTLVIPIWSKPLWSKPSLDLTADVIAKLDVDYGQNAELIKLRAEVEQMKGARPPPDAAAPAPARKAVP